MKLWLSLLIIAFSGIATARSASSVAMLKHRKEMRLKKKEMWVKSIFALATAQQILVVKKSLSAGDRHMWERLSAAGDRRIRELSLLGKRQTSLESLESLESQVMLLATGDRQMRLESQIALFLAHIQSRIALGRPIAAIGDSKSPRLVYYEDGGRGGSMPDRRRGGSSSRHPADIDHNRPDHGPDGRGGGPVDSPPPKDKGRSSSPDKK